LPTLSRSSYWPWDEQTCKIVLGSWTKTGEELDVINMSGENVTTINMHNYVPTVWDVKTALGYRDQIYQILKLHFIIIINCSRDNEDKLTCGCNLNKLSK
jgi:hypothetical protein